MTQAVLVTGAGGFVGSHLLDLLRQDDADIVGWHRRPRRHETHGVRWRQVDLLDRQAVRQAVCDVEPAAVYHLAGSAHVAQSWQYVLETYEGNVLATHHLFEALRRLRYRPRVIVACTGHVYAPQPHPIREDDELKPTS